MGIVSSHDNAANPLLNLIARTEQMLLRLNHGKDLVVVAHHATQIHRADHLGVLRDSLGQLVIVHLHIVLLAVHHHHLATNMLGYRSRSGISICRNNYLVLRANTYQTQSHFHGSRGGVQAYSLIRPHVSGNLLLKLLGLRTSCNPTT